MAESTPHETTMLRDDPEPRWTAVLAILAVSGLYLALPRYLTIGPRWLLFTVVTALMIPTIVTFRMHHDRLNQILGSIMIGVVTLFMITSVGLLIHALPTHKEPPLSLLRSAAALWVTNILVFASWYWRLDAGGPHQRALTLGHNSGAFLFPQMVLTPDVKAATGQTDWSPTFIDYLFLAFNTSTALSPADTAILARWAKAFMMVQATISLCVIALLAGRAVNIL